MKLCPIIIILTFLWCAVDVRAQEPEEFSSMPEQWQLTLDVIKSKAQNLMIENNGLQVKNRQLIGQVQELQQSVEGQQIKNEQMGRILKERHGRTDQQARIEELTDGIKTKRQRVRSFDEQLEGLKRKQADIGHKIQRLKYTISGIDLHQQAAKERSSASSNSAGSQDDDLDKWRQQLEDENRQEVLLENELEDLKTGGTTQNLNVDAIDAQNKEFEAHLDSLRLQKLQHIKGSSDAVLTQVNARKYAQLKKLKEQLEADISGYESRLDGLRGSSVMSLSWQEKKKNLIHEMVQTDARNNKIRDMVKVLREDIDILRDQVARLERRLDFAQDKDAKR